MDAVAEGNKIIIIVGGCFVVFCCFVELVRRESQRQINDDGESDRTGGADRRAAGVDHNHCQRARRKGNDRGNDSCLCHGLSFYFKSKFHARS